jgi:hypothetical protein
VCEMCPVCESQGCGAVCCVISSLLMITALVSISVGIALSAEASEIDPDADFTELGRVCKLTSVSQTMDNGKITCHKQGEHRVCSDQFSWTFSVPEMGEYQSLETEFIARCDPCDHHPPRPCPCDDAATPALPPLNLDEMATCWEPKNPETVRETYRCGNAPCYRIIDPAEDVEALQESASSLITFFVVFFLVPSIVGLGAVGHCSSKGKCLAECCGSARTHPS